MSTRCTLLLLAIALVALPHDARGQGMRIDLSPRVAAYARTSDVGAAAPAVGPWYVKLDQIDAAPALEIEARATWPGSPLGLRLIGLAVLPAEVSGIFDCYPGLACPAVLLRSEAEASVLAAAVDAQYAPLRAGHGVRPWVSFGAGVKRYSFSWPSAEVFVESGSHAETSLVLRAGLGVEFDVRGQSIRAEVADWWSGEGGKIGDDPGVLGLSAPRRRAQHDIAMSIGWRLLRF